MLAAIKGNWFYRQIFTYLPIFFSISSTLIFFIFLSTSQIIQGEVAKADGIFLQHAIQSIDYALESIDQQMIKETMMNVNLQKFAGASANESDPLVDYRLSSDLRGFAISNPLIDSIYFYREIDRAVLTTNQLTPLNNFSDREFLLQLSGNKPQFSWSGPRSYVEFPTRQEPVQVVSLVRMLLSDQRGYLVVNVKTDSIKRMVDTMSTSQVTLIDIFDPNGTLLWGTDDGHNPLPKKTSGTELFQIQSNYTNWVYRSGLKDANVYGVASSAISYFWIAGGLFIAVIGGILIVYVIRWNYKPMETTLKRIRSYSIPGSAGAEAMGKQNDFTFIGVAFENLVKRSTGVLKQYEENLIYRKMHFFRKLMSEDHRISEAEWNYETEQLGLRQEFDQLSVAVVEIDNYYEFHNKYSAKDQSLLKFIISNVLAEMAHNRSLLVWSEWLSRHQLSVLFQVTEKNVNAREMVFDLCEQMRRWVEHNLKFTVTIGIGNPTKQIPLISDCCQEALDSTKYKTALGNNRIIGYWEISAREYGEGFRHMHFIRSMSQHLRLGEREWETSYKQFMNEIKAGFFAKDEIVSQLNYLIYYLYKDFMELSAEFQDIWIHTALPQLNQLIERFDTIEQVEDEFYAILAQAKEQMDLLRDNKTHFSHMQKIKAYVEEHYADQHISLNSLSDEFGISPKYISKLFKDEFGVKFVDYLVSIRVEQAKKMLCETTESIRDIAAGVGYTHSLSFIRVFKKIVGLTPGDYRKVTADQLK